MVTVLNLSQELVPVAGASNVTLSVTGSSALLTAGVTIAAATNIVQVQPQGGNIRYTVDGSAPTTSTGMIWQEAGILQMHVGSAAAFRYCGDGADTPTLVVSQFAYAANAIRRAADLSVAIESKKFIDVVKWVLRQWGVQAGTWLSDAATTADDKARLVDLLNDNMRVIWQRGRWPKLTVIEEREVDTTPGFNLVPYAETGYINLGDVFAVWDKDPRIRGEGATPLKYDLGTDGIILPSEQTTTVFVQHRIRPHQFTLEAYAGGTTYAAGDLVYYDTTGECYRRLSAGSGVAPIVTTTWEVMRLPADFANYVQQQTLSDFLVNRQPKDSARWAARADDSLWQASKLLPIVHAHHGE